MAQRNFWADQDINGGPIDVSQPLAEHNDEAGPGSGTAKIAAQSQSAENKLPTQYTLSQNYPNPFNPGTKIQFTLPNQSLVSVFIYNAQGSLVRKLISQKTYAGGQTELAWDGKNDHGFGVSSGVYFYRLMTFDTDKTFSTSRRMVVVK